MRTDGHLVGSCSVLNPDPKKCSLAVQNVNKKLSICFISKYVNQLIRKFGFKLFKNGSDELLLTAELHELIYAGRSFIILTLKDGASLSLVLS